MSDQKGLVVDANILMRAVFGRRVMDLLEKYEDKARFYTPDFCFREAIRYVPLVASKRGLNADRRLAVLQQLGHLVDQVDRSLYRDFEPALANASISAIPTTGQSLP